MLDIFKRYDGPHLPRVTTYSTLTGKRFLTSFDAAYYWSNSRSPVLFQHAISSIARLEPASVFVEIAPHPVLSPYVITMIDGLGSVLSAAKRPKRGEPPMEMRTLLEAIGSLILSGNDAIDFSLLNGGRLHKHAHSILPSYPFNGKKFPLYPNSSGYQKQMATRDGPLNFKYLAVNKETYPLLAEHVVGGEPIMPAAAFLEMVREITSYYILMFIMSVGV